MVVSIRCCVPLLGPGCQMNAVETGGVVVINVFFPVHNCAGYEWTILDYF